MGLELHIKFYISPSGKKNMWIEQNNNNGVRHEIQSTEDAFKILEEYIKNFCDM